MNEQQVIDKVKELSNKVHQRTLRGGAELVLLSERTYEVIEDRIHENILNERWHVMQPSEWDNPPMAPCDIRAMYFGGNVEPKTVGGEQVSYGDDLDEKVNEKTDGEYAPLDIPEIEFGFAEEGVDNVTEQYTFDE